MKYKKISQEKHEFALFVESLSLCIQQKQIGDTIVLADENILHRMIHILRLKVHDHCILFDRSMRASVIIDEVLPKKKISIIIQSIEKNETYTPTITFLLPLLKRDDYESALYNLAEVGTTIIQLIFTEKTTQQWNSRDIDRAQRILTGAAEQSKNFAYSEMREPITLLQALKEYETIDLKLFFDPKGKHLFEVMNIIYASKIKNILLLIGPEGDLTVEEKRIVQLNGFIFCALTPTTIRAAQAAAFGAGFVRSLFNSNFKQKFFK